MQARYTGPFKAARPPLSTTPYRGHKPGARQLHTCQKPSYTDLCETVPKLCELERRISSSKPSAPAAYRACEQGRRTAEEVSWASEVAHAAAVRMIARGCAHA